MLEAFFVAFVNCIINKKKTKRLEKFFFFKNRIRIERARWSFHHIMLCFNHSVQSHFYSFIYRISFEYSTVLVYSGELQ